MADLNLDFVRLRKDIEDHAHQYVLWKSSIVSLVAVVYAWLVPWVLSTPEAGYLCLPWDENMLPQFLSPMAQTQFKKMYGNVTLTQRVRSLSYHLSTPGCSGVFAALAMTAATYTWRKDHIRILLHLNKGCFGVVASLRVVTLLGFVAFIMFPLSSGPLNIPAWAHEVAVVVFATGGMLQGVTTMVITVRLFKTLSPSVSWGEWWKTEPLRLRIIFGANIAAQVLLVVSGLVTFGIALCLTISSGGSLCGGSCECFPGAPPGHTIFVVAELGAIMAYFLCVPLGILAVQEVIRKKGVFPIASALPPPAAPGSAGSAGSLSRSTVVPTTIHTRTTRVSVV